MFLSAVQSHVLALAALLPACSAGSAMGGGGSFDEARAWKDLEHQVGLGPRPPGSEALERTRAYIEQELSKAGLKPVRESFEVPAPPASGGAMKPAHAIAMANVYADLAAKDPKAETVILCTHFDTKISSERFVGANDGGSGTAVLLELARVLAADGPRDLAYRFLFLDGEEALRWDWAGDDNTYGSRHHAAELKKSGKAASVRCCILLDMVGDKDLRFWNEAYSNSRLASIVVDAAASEGLSDHVNGKREQARDDHLSFMAVGIPSLDLIDFDYGPDNAWWHSKDDTLDKCSAKSLGITGRLVLASLPGIEHSFARE
jgi:glutaminyl-peptide cyclotransferase